MSELEDFPRDGGLIRRIRFTDTDFVIVDASERSVTTNWTSWFSPLRFVEMMDSFSDFSNSDVFLDLSKPEILSFSFHGWLDFMQGDIEIFNEMCKLIRFDVSDTQSVAWERLVLENRPGFGFDGDLIFVGFGESTSKYVSDHGGNGMASLLLHETASPKIDVNDVLSSVSDLAGKFYRS